MHFLMLYTVPHHSIALRVHNPHQYVAVEDFTVSILFCTSISSVCCLFAAAEARLMM